jgi:iron complex transport system substrate-binding protein
MTAPGFSLSRSFTIFLVVSVIVILMLVYLPVAGFAAAEGKLPERIVSLGPAITEKLFLLGAADRLVGVTTYCQRPPEARRKEKIGSVTHASIEKIVQLKPDLVLATSLTEARAIARLKHLGLDVRVYEQPASFDDMNRQFIELGCVVGKKKEAEEIVAASVRAVEAVKKRVAGLVRPKVFIEVGAKPLFTVPKDSFMNDFIEFGGGVNIAREAPSGFFSTEEVLKQDPDVIIIVTMGITGEIERRRWRSFPVLSAVKHDRIFLMDSYSTCSPTPVTFVQALEQITAMLHPETKAGGR